MGNLLKKLVSKIKNTLSPSSAGKRATEPNVAFAIQPAPPSVPFLNPNYFNWPLPKSTGAKHSEILDGDFIDISKPIVSNTAFQDTELNHITSLRPEIIASTELYPIYPDEAASGENLTSVGKLITFQYQSQQMKSAVLKELVKAIYNNKDTAGNILSSFDERYKLVSDVQKELTLVGQTQDKLRKVLDFRKNIEGVISIPNIETIGDTRSFGIVRKTVPNIMSVNQLIQKITGYNQSQLNSFTNSKIFMTLCSDIEQALTNGVYNNLSVDTDQERISDLHPTKIDVTHTIAASLDVETLNAPFGQASQMLMVESTKFDRFQTTLPTDPYQRLIFIINFLSKELTSSRYLHNLSKQSNTSINGNFYNEIFGKPGTDIFSKITGDKSLISISSLLDLQKNATVLPFEDVYIQNNTDNSQLSNKYIPGKRYFVDSILDGIVTNALDLNTKPITDYAERTQAVINDVSSVLSDISNIKSSYFIYSASKTYRYLLSQIDSSSAGLTQSNKAVKEQAIAFALFRKASEDSRLKLMIFQYLVYLGIFLRKSHASQNQYIIFDSVANEVGSSSKLNFLTNPLLDSTIVNPATRNITPVSFSNLTNAQTGVMSEQLKIFASNIAKYVTKNSYTNRTGANYYTNQVIVEASEEAIINLLISPIENTSFIAKGTVFHDFFDFIQAIDKITEAGFFTAAGGTRFRGIRTTNIVYVIYEMYVTLAKIFGYTEFSISQVAQTGSTSSQHTVTKGSVIINWYKHAIAREKIQLLIGKNSAIVESVNSNNQLNAINTVDTLKIVGSGTILSAGSVATFSFSNGINNNSSTSSQNSDERIRSQNNAAGVMSDVFLLFGEGADLGTNALPVQGSKVYDIYQKLWDEDWLYPVMINGFLSLINTNIAMAIKANLQVFLNPNNLKTIRGTKLRPEVENLRIFDQAIAEYTQLRGTLRDTPTKEDLIKFFENLSPSPMKLKLLLSMFKESSFLSVGNPKETRARVLSIGIPNGMVSSLNYTKLLTSINSNTTGRNFFTNQSGFESDIIKINVYRRDLRFDNLIFKPKTYYFDASLFLNETVWGTLQKAINSNQTTNPNSYTFDELVAKTTFFEYETNEAFNPSAVISKDIKFVSDINLPYAFHAEPYGSNIPKNVRFEILRNTFQSYLLQYYISLTTGMIIDEKTFTTNNSTVSSLALGSSFMEEVITYLKTSGEPIANNNIREILANKNVSQHARTLIEFVNSVTLVLDPGAIYTNLANNPLSFDRVFHIVETADAYEIDVEKTKLTKDGLKLLNSDKFNESLVKIGTSYYLPFTGMDDVSISDYFIDIEVAEF